MSDLDKEDAIKVIYYYNNLYGNLKQIGLYPEKRRNVISKITGSGRQQDVLEDELYNIMMTVLAYNE